VKKPDIRRATLEQIREMDRRGELYRNPDAPVGPPPGEELPADFWEKAELVDYSKPRSVHLKLDPEVYLHFKAQGKGHITRMQNVLKAYVKAKRKA
jgi:uncharacterized protein (DUF4415 family)